MFRKNDKIPDEIRSARLERWYSNLDDQSRLRLARYLKDIDDASSPFEFFRNAIECSISDENFGFAVKLCEECYEQCEISDYQSFKINEMLIVAYYGSKRYDDTKAACEANFKLFPSVKEELLADNGGIMPETLWFRNHYIDVIVGIESNYDLAFRMLEEYNQMGVLSDEDLVYRRNSLTTHRLQKVFDGVYTYRPSGEDL